MVKQDCHRQNKRKRASNKTKKKQQFNKKKFK